MPGENGHGVRCLESQLGARRPAGTRPPRPRCLFPVAAAPHLAAFARVAAGVGPGQRRPICPRPAP